MQAIKIDVVAKTLSEVELSGGEPIQQKGEVVGYDKMLRPVQAAVGRSPIIRAFDFGKGDSLYVNGDALLRSPDEVSGWFLFDGISDPLAYNGVVVNETSKLTRPPKITVAEVAARVRFLYAEEALDLIRQVAPSEGGGLTMRAARLSGERAPPFNPLTPR